MKPACRARGSAPAKRWLPDWLNPLARSLWVGLWCLVLSLGQRLR